MSLPQLLAQLNRLVPALDQAWEQRQPEFPALEARYIGLYEQAIDLGWWPWEPLPEAKFPCIKGSGRCSLSQGTVTDCIYTRKTCPWVKNKEKEG